ncbi:hypothetical protein CVT25_003837 [Psilocybe cyanescens]|uniref:Uncharacterized protein n=1 Tax=Psilocybe cyanescens TaxID=93625 RepID=A0A409XPW8_PSICY|nr:hypothetical protein CVT25_003837 [Psilocybe cyanescens]
MGPGSTNDCRLNAKNGDEYNPSRVDKSANSGEVGQKNMAKKISWEHRTRVVSLGTVFERQRGERWRRSVGKNRSRAPRPGTNHGPGSDPRGRENTGVTVTDLPNAG